MFSTWQGIIGLFVGVGLTLGLILTPHVMPGGWGYRMGWSWSGVQITAAGLVAILLLTFTLWVAGRLVSQATTWKDRKVIMAAILIALVANGLFMCCVEWFDLTSGWRVLIAACGVPFIYGNLVRQLGRMTLGKAMESILQGALCTMGPAYILAAIIRGW
jgi:hypothetical protein